MIEKNISINLSSFKKSDLWLSNENCTKTDLSINFILIFNVFKIIPEHFKNNTINIYFAVYAFAGGGLCHRGLVQFH